MTIEKMVTLASVEIIKGEVWDLTVRLKSKGWVLKNGVQQKEVRFSNSLNVRGKGAKESKSPVGLQV